MASGCRAPSRVASDPGLCCLPWIATLCSLLAASCPQVWPTHIGGSLPGHVRSGDVWSPWISAPLSAHSPHTSLLLGGVHVGGLPHTHGKPPPESRCLTSQIIGTLLRGVCFTHAHTARCASTLTVTHCVIHCADMQCPSMEPRRGFGTIS
jgi:hypothetical protein